MILLLLSYIPDSKQHIITPIKLDKAVYSWTDKVYITIAAPDHNSNGNVTDEIGSIPSNPITIATRGHQIDQYKLVETGPNTGVFAGHVILTGFGHNADGNRQTGNTNGHDTNPRTGNGNTAVGLGPTDGFLETGNVDGITISFELSPGKTIVGFAPIQWNVGQVQWLESNYPATGAAVLRVIDTDMNLNPESIDNFSVNVWSTTDFNGIDITVTETGPATGVFEGTTFFTVDADDNSTSSKLLVSPGDTITGKYQDNTLPQTLCFLGCA